MTFFKRIYFLIPVLILCAAVVKGQDQPIGYWRSFLPYNSALGLATDGNMLYTVGKQAFFTYTPSSGQLDAYSKIEGMSDIAMQCIGYDMATSTAILVYANGNIDLFKDNTFYNIPDLKIKTVAGAKTVYHVYTFNGRAYLSTSLGVIVIDLTERSISETYKFSAGGQTLPVKDMLALGDDLYAVTANGIFKVNRNNPAIQDYQVWQKIDTPHNYNDIVNLNGTLYVASSQQVFRLVNGAAPVLIYTSPSVINRLNAGNNVLFVSEYIDTLYTGAVKIISAAGAVADSFSFVGRPMQVVQLADNSIWVAESGGGLMKRIEGNQLSYYTPAGPIDPNAYDIYVHNRDLWIAHGGFTDRYLPQGSIGGMANYKDDKWKYYSRDTYAPFANVRDLVVITKDETDGTIYTGAFMDGLVILKTDGTSQLLRENSIFDPSLSYQPPARNVVGVALDADRNLWVSTMNSVHQLYVKTADSVWYKFLVPNGQSGGPIVIDNNGQVWFVSNSGGLNVYNTNGTVTDQSDDMSYHLTTGHGFGNLPGNNVYCIAKDKNNNIWVGTNNGIGIVSNCSAPFTQSPPCDADIPIVQYDQYAGYLFAGNNVRTIAVDGANRKWVGTDDGVWLLSPDAGKIVYRFTKDNSPLPSNYVRKIAIDDVTGDVYIGTDNGLVSYRSTATDGGTANEDVITFPNPVPSGYTGTIAVKGLVANADVRITDINGQLAYRTKALGGQAVWNGLDYKGHRPQSGVYLIFVSNNDGSATHTGKVVFLK